MALDKLFLGESKSIEYKVDVPGKSEKYMKTVVAFANGRGGRIVFGIDDSTLDVTGMNPDTIFQTIDSITNAISDSCEPRIIPDVTLQTVGDKTVIVVEISSGKMRPYYLKSKGIVDGTFIRVAGTTRLAPDFMLKELILEGQNRYYDSEPCDGLTVTKDDIKKLCDDLKKVALEHALTDAAKAEIKDVTENVLLSWGILWEKDGEIVPTNAYALLTGKNTMQQNIQCAIFKGNDRAYFVDRREFNGPIQEQMEAAYQYVLEKINRGMKIDGIYRQDVYELPVDSIRELIANAVAHRSYLDPGNIQVALYDNRLEITSPGMLMNGVTIEKMKEGYSKIRNRAIANAFSYMKIIEKWGSGIPRIIRECQEYGIPEPELIDFDGDFRINMYRQPSLIQAGTIGTNSGTIGTNSDTIGTIIGIKVTSPEERVLTIMKQNAKVTQKELQKELGVSLRTVKRMIAELQDKGYIVRRGNNRSGEWIVKG